MPDDSVRIVRRECIEPARRDRAVRQQDTAATVRPATCVILHQQRTSSRKPRANKRAGAGSPAPPRPASCTRAIQVAPISPAPDASSSFAASLKRPSAASARKCSISLARSGGVPPPNSAATRPQPARAQEVPASDPAAIRAMTRSNSSARSRIVGVPSLIGTQPPQRAIDRGRDTGRRPQAQPRHDRSAGRHRCRAVAVTSVQADRPRVPSHRSPIRSHADRRFDATDYRAHGSAPRHLRGYHEHQERRAQLSAAR